MVSRLLLKSLSEQQQPLLKSIESLQGKAAALRRRLLRIIENKLAHPGSQVKVLVDAICAYCLVTSASSGDAIEHFRKVRLDKLRERVAESNRDQSQIEEDFRYLIVSVQCLKALLGRSVNDALSALQKHPILQDQHILQMDLLDIDRLQKLIPQDILSFTPYIKRVLLKKEEIQKISSDWIRNACAIFSTGLHKVLDSTNSVEGIFNLRKSLLSILLPICFSIHSQEILLEVVRNATNARVLEICRSQIDLLVHIGQDVVTARAGQDTSTSLWDQSLTKGKLASNSSKYVHGVRAHHLGTGGSLAQSIKKIHTWAKQIARLRDQIQLLESARWQDLIEDPDDEDDDTAKSITVQLSKDDPKHFKEAMDSAIQVNIQQFSQVIHEAANQITGDTDSSSETERGARIVYLLRSIRESSSVLIKTAPDAHFETKELVTKLHESLAEYTSSKIKRTLDQSTPSPRAPSFVSEDLPSPDAFKLLRDICKVMEDIGGTDIWSRAAVTHVKNTLQAELLDKPTTTPYIRSQFDREYLQAALSAQESKEKDSNSDEPKRKAVAYWQRTKLLFGALS